MMYPQYMDSEICAKCGSGDTSIERVEFGTNILVWRRCNECGCLFIDAYEHSIKGIVDEEGM